MPQQQSPDYPKVTSTEIEQVDLRDYPDLCDAYIARAMVIDPISGQEREATEEELDAMNDDAIFQYEAIWDSIH